MTGALSRAPEKAQARGTIPFTWSLLATHAVVWLFFADTRILVSVTNAVEPYCWPYFELCSEWRPPIAFATVLLMMYLVGGVFTGVAIGHGRERLAWWGLLLLNMFLAAVVSLDYRLRANEFYMLLWVNAAWLVSPRSRWLVPVTIISCYFWAGVLKLNREWLSGAGLYSDLWMIPDHLVPVACAYVVVLEMVMIWGLLSKRTFIVAAVLTQLGLFHLESLSQIHWFYPLLMAMLLSWFVIERVTAPASNRASIGELVRGRAPRLAYLLMAVFAVLQLARFAYRGDSVLTGQGRIFALHMFEARHDCEVTAIVNRTAESLHLKVSRLAPRMICDPIVYFNRARNLCRTRRKGDICFDFRLVMNAKRATDEKFTTVIDAQDFCEADYTYSIIRNNPWMR